MGVDTFWKRVPEAALAGAGPEALCALVPYWFDDLFETEQQEGRLVGAEDTGALIITLLDLGVADDDDAAAALTLLADKPSDWDDDWLVGTIAAPAVGQIAAFLATAPLGDWSRDGFADLAEEAQELGYQRPFDDRWAARVLHDAEELEALFRAAATAGEAVIVKISA